MTTTHPAPTVSPARAAQIADACADAFSFNAYGAAGWRSAATLLASRGLTAEQIEAVLRSKWTRWAGNMATGNGQRRGQFSGHDLARFMDSKGRLWWSRVARLTAETF